MNFREKGCPGGCQPPAGPMMPKYPTPPQYQVPKPPLSGAGPVKPEPVPPITGIGPMFPMPEVEPSKSKPQPSIPKTGPTPPTAALNVFPVDEGFLKGTMFRGVYRPYKNYQSRMAVPADEKATMMLDVDKYAFAAHDIQLYLDNYPNDQEAINLFNQYVDGYVRAKNVYEEKYGALTIESDSLTTAPFNWTVGGWPWVGGV